MVRLPKLPQTGPNASCCNSLTGRGSEPILDSWCQTLQVRRGLKIAAISILVFLGIVITFDIFSPYTVWYFVVPDARLIVDGRPAKGWLHRGHHGESLFLTRRDRGKAESYMIWIPHDRQGGVLSCGH